jgi:hypothetical protein
MKASTSLPSILLGAIVTILLLVNPAAAATPNHNGAQNNIVTGTELVIEMHNLHRALSQVQDLLNSAEIPADDELMSKAAKLVRRVRSLVYATNNEIGAHEARKQTEIVQRRRADERIRVKRRMMGLDQEEEDEEQIMMDEEMEIEQRRQRRADERIRIRRAMRGSLVVGDLAEEDAQMLLLLEEEQEELMQLEEEGLLVPEAEDSVQRNMYEETITFPECQEMLLDRCLQILNEELLQLQIEAEFIIHEKRNEDQAGYNKVVIITDLGCTTVKGKLNDGLVEYPFLWDDSILGARRLGINGKWDCHEKAPEECCAEIQNSVPHPDTKGNYLQCHIFVPFGGVGNKSRSDRVFINLSPDGRVHEPPVIH